MATLRADFRDKKLFVKLFGREVYAVGGYVRDLIRKNPSDEVDSTISYAFGKVKLLKDNVEQYFAESNWESLRESMGRRLPHWNLAWGHQHGQAATDTDVGEETQKIADRPPLQYGYLDFDPLKDGSYSLESAGAASLDLDLNSDVSSGTVRVIPVELVSVPGA